MEPERKTWRIYLSYLGTRFAGFQKQPGLESIESSLERAFFELIGQAVDLTVAGRTDSGVHAKGQVISCHFKSRFTEHNLPPALSHFVEPDISVYRADIMSDCFDAKRHAVGKRYLYHINTSGRPYPFVHATSWDIRQKLD